MQIRDMGTKLLGLSLSFLGVLILSSVSQAHGVDDDTRQFLINNQGVNIIPFLYIGAKHMISGYDHLLFLVGVIFFLFRAKEVLIYVSFFTIGHSVTLLFGVLNDINVNAYLIDAIIGFSIVYKGFDNLGGFQRFLGFQPNTKAAVLIFGLFHGFGLATKLQEFQMAKEGLLENLLAFNIGVELGQFLALSLILITISYWRRSPRFLSSSVIANSLIMSGGMMFIGFQLTGYFLA